MWIRNGSSRTYRGIIYIWHVHWPSQWQPNLRSFPLAIPIFTAKSMAWRYWRAIELEASQINFEMVKTSSFYNHSQKDDTLLQLFLWNFFFLLRISYPLTCLTKQMLFCLLGASANSLKCPHVNIDLKVWYHNTCTCPYFSKNINAIMYTRSLLLPRLSHRNFETKTTTWSWGKKPAVGR